MIELSLSKKIENKRQSNKYFCQAKCSSDEKAHEDSSWSTMRQIISYRTVCSSSSRTKPSEHVQAERGNV